MLRAVVTFVLLVVPAAAAADIYVWRDSQGVKHYTNSRGLIPSGAQAAVILEEPVQTASASTVVAPEPPPGTHEDVQRAPVEAVYDPNALAAAFEEGWLRGLAFSQGQHAAAPVNVSIRGPFVAASNQNTGAAEDPYWPDSFYPSLVTTSFDGGRSRHLTLRMLMQDQFAIDRAGPYLVVDRFPPRGPNLATFLPRGLPLVIRPGSRVVTH